MEIKEPVAIFNAEGFKMLIDALQGNTIDLKGYLEACTGERIGEPIDPPEKEIDSFIDGYNQFKAGESESEMKRSHRTPEVHYDSVFNLLKNADGPLEMSQIRSLLASEYGIIRDPKSYTQLLIGAMRRYPIEKIGFGTYGLKQEFMDEDIFDGGNENE